MRNGCNSFLKHVQPYMEAQFKRQKQTFYNSFELDIIWYIYSHIWYDSLYSSIQPELFWAKLFVITSGIVLQPSERTRLSSSLDAGCILFHILHRLILLRSGLWEDSLISSIVWFSIQLWLGSLSKRSCCQPMVYRLCICSSTHFDKIPNTAGWKALCYTNGHSRSWLPPYIHYSLRSLERKWLDLFKMF